MTRSRSCFGDLEDVRSCWGYKSKIVRNKSRYKSGYNAVIENIPYRKKDELVLSKNVEIFTYKSLQKATNNFTTMLGKGGFGSCYKGMLQDGTTIAVKVFEDNIKVVDLFSLTKTMLRIRHRNVVELLGCCIEGSYKIMVYEFVGDYNLGQLLFNPDAEGAQLSWSMRASICIGVARGLDYLHHGVTPRVIHRDIKPYNVLIDENFNPKITDFDISRPLEDDSSHCSSPIAGTHGYLDPEYMISGRITEKADVYGFGILLLEVITGRKNSGFFRESSYSTLVEWAWELREMDRVMEVVDPTLFEFPVDELVRFINVALLCVQQSANMRPSMTEVLFMLLGDYDLSKKVLKRPYQSQWSQNYGEVDSLVSGEIEITPAKDPEFMLRSQRDAMDETKGQMICRDNIEIESGLGSDSSGGELMQMSLDLEIELYSSIQPHKPIVISESGPSDRTAGESEMMNTSKSNALALKGDLQEAERMQMPNDMDTEFHKSNDPDTPVTVSMSGPSLGTSAEPKMITSFAQDQIYSYSEAYQENEVLSPQKVIISRPIHSTVEKILKAFTDDNYRVICLHGRAGSGKTTVLKTLLHHSAMKQIFNKLLFVNVPRLAHQQKIQNEIIQQLSLDVQHCKDEKEKAYRIHQALSDCRLLLLLDDVSEVINLHEIGIPVPAPNSSIWLVTATRSLDPYDTLAEKKIEMEVLSHAEAWELFQYQVGDIVSPEIEPYAQAIAEECHGLPLIVSSVGSALRSEASVVEWKLALTNFQNFNKSNLESQYSLSPPIKYCYDRLKAHDLKTCFLYCALFPRDNEIDISSLVDCFVNEGLLGGRTVAAYKRGHDIVEHLVNSSLLEAIEKCPTVKMHNVIRDSALAILSSSTEGYEVLTRSNLGRFLISNVEHNYSFEESGSSTKLVGRQDSCSMKSSHILKYLTRAGSQHKEPLSVKEWEEATMIFLMDNGLTTLPSNPSCPNLVALCLQRNKCLRVIPASFFDDMISLRILNLSRTRIKSLPDSVSYLKNLEVLTMHDCERLLMLPSSIGLLKKLEVLNLQGTELSHLPESVGELASLKQLRVSFFGTMNHSEYKKLPAKFIPNGMISGLKLRELGIFVHPGDERWILFASDIIKEVKNLKLSALSFHFPEVEQLELFLHESLYWENLRLFNFIVGCDFKRIVSQVPYDAEFMYSEEERCLKFVNGENIPSSVKKIITLVTSFYLDHHLSIRYLSDFDNDRMKGFKFCILRDCPKLLAIVHVDNHVIDPVLPFLKHLHITHLWNLKSIWTGHIVTGSLARLKYLSLHACPKMRYVLTCSMTEMLLNLEELLIEECESLEHIVMEDEKVDDETCNNPSSMPSFLGVTFPVLSSLKQMKLHHLPQLCGIWKGPWPPLECLSFYDCPKLKNLKMEVDDGLNIKEIATDKAWWGTLEWDDPQVCLLLQERVSEICADDL